MAPPDLDLDLDDLSAEAIEALPFGVILVDPLGRVLSYNAAESRFSGRAVGDVLGRNFFKDVAPCTNLPAFYGRFLGGVRSGALSERLTFTFGFQPQPVRVAVHMRSSRTPGRYWIVVQPIEWVSREPLAAAAPEVGRRARAETVDVSACEREPIHIPGAVQPHAALLALDPVSWRVLACSENTLNVLGREPPTVLGAAAADVLPAGLLEALAAHALDPGAPLRWEARVGEPERRVTVVAHRQSDRVLVELEPAPEHPGDFGAPSPMAVSAAVSALAAAPELSVVAQTAVDALKALTGFQRVMVYRFDADWNGEAIAEAREPAAYDSLLGLRFPASDIPAQARALYVRAPARFVVDRDYVPVPLVADPAAGNAPIDLSFAGARSLSPIHLEYQRNLGVNGSMSSSIVVDGRLWGLVIGHHRRPHYLPPESRAAIAMITDALSLRIGALEQAAQWREQEAHLSSETALLQQMAGADDLIAALMDGETPLLQLFGAGGAAVVDESAVHLAGDTPGDEAVLAIRAWLLEQPSEALVFATDRLASRLPAAAAWTAQASGLLAAFTAPERRRLLLWFRPEVVQAIAWGGDPNKPVDVAGAGATLLPRRSFERWIEEQRGHAEPWRDWQIAAAARIASAVERVSLRQNRRIGELNERQEALVAALVEKDQALAQKDVLTREIDHRVKNSLTIVASFLQMQARTVGDQRARDAFEETYARVMSVARIHDSLYQSDDVEEVDIGQTIERLCQDLSGMAGERHTLAVSATPQIMVPYRRAVGLALIATELVTNALKYAYRPDEAGAVDVSVRPREDGVCLTVSDNGRGLPANWGEPAGGRVGLGMKLIRAMLAQIDGEMQVETHGGARFTVCA